FFVQSMPRASKQQARYAVGRCYQADQHYLNQVAMSLNTRPRKALDWLTPLEKFAQLVDYHMAFETVAPHV
ncbi:hypothetical protein ACSZND_23985, partial [Aeromonas hydrophila]